MKGSGCGWGGGVLCGRACDFLTGSASASSLDGPSNSSDDGEGGGEGGGGCASSARSSTAIDVTVLPPIGRAAAGAASCRGVAATDDALSRSCCPIASASLSSPRCSEMNRLRARSAARGHGDVSRGRARAAPLLYPCATALPAKAPGFEWRGRTEPVGDDAEGVGDDKYAHQAEDDGDPAHVLREGRHVAIANGGQSVAIVKYQQSIKSQSQPSSSTSSSPVAVALPAEPASSS